MLYAASSRLGIGQPYFAPTILDGRVAKFTTGKAAERVISGFLRTAETERALQQWNAAEVDGSTWIAIPREGFGFFESLTASAERRAAFS